MKLLVTLVSVLCLRLLSFAQCAECTPDPSCTTTNGLPALCPEILPDATAGEYYQQIITFYMPPVVTDPSSGFTANLLTVEVTSVTGLPFGFEFTLNESDGIFEPGNGQNLGCATLCGTPLLPGNFEMIITVLGTVETGGFSFQQSLPFSYPVTVVPGSGANTSFNFTQPAGCDSLEVAFTATVEAPAPAITSYEWFVENDLLSNNSSFNAFFEQPGEYPVSLTTTISNYRLTEVNLTAVAGGWGSDEDIFGSPDPYFSLLDGNGTVVYTSTPTDNSLSAVWSGLNIPLENPPYSLSFADDDPVTSDDDLGSVNLDVVGGVTTFDTAGGTSGTLTIALVPVSVISDTTTIVVFPSASLSLALSGTTLQAIPSDLESYEWSLNGEVIEGANSASLTNPQEGIYSCVGFNTFGCPSAPATFVVCPAVQIEWDFQAMELFVGSGFDSYQWYFNGVAIQGAQLFYLIAPQDGVYTVVIETQSGCTVESEPFVVNSIHSGSSNGFKVYPNPAVSMIRMETPGTVGDWSITNGFGSLVMKGISQKSQTDIDIEFLSPGVYIIECSFGRIPFLKTN